MPHISSAPTQGHPSPGRSAPPCSAAESVRADTLRALPENAATPATTEQEGTGTSALSLQTAQRDGIILARIIPSHFCMRLALLRQVVQQRSGQLRVMRQRRTVQMSHRRNQTHRRRQPHAVRLE